MDVRDLGIMLDAEVTMSTHVSSAYLICHVRLLRSKLALRL